LDAPGIFVELFLAAWDDRGDDREAVIERRAREDRTEAPLLNPVWEVAAGRDGDGRLAALDLRRGERLGNVGFFEGLDHFHSSLGFSRRPRRGWCGASIRSAHAGCARRRRRR